MWSERDTKGNMLGYPVLLLQSSSRLPTNSIPLQFLACITLTFQSLCVGVKMLLWWIIRKTWFCLIDFHLVSVMTALTVMVKFIAYCFWNKLKLIFRELKTQGWLSDTLQRTSTPIYPEFWQHSQCTCLYRDVVKCHSYIWNNWKCLIPQYFKKTKEKESLDCQHDWHTGI